MLTLCCSTIYETPRPSSEKGYVLFLLKPDARRSPLSRLMGGGTDAATWQRYGGKAGTGRRFTDKAAALRVLRREIRTGEAQAARLCWGGEVVQEYGRCALTGREVPLHIDG
jgi:hypothetical protein